MHPDKAIDYRLHLVRNDILQQRLLALKENELHCVLLTLHCQNLIVWRELDRSDSTATITHAKRYHSVLYGTFDNHARCTARANCKNLQLID